MSETGECPCWKMEHERKRFDCGLCPAFKSGRPCWEFDWIRIFDSESSPQVREVWKRHMGRCLDCECYGEHEKEMRPVLEHMGVIPVPMEVVEVPDARRDASLFSFEDCQ